MSQDLVADTLNMIMNAKRAGKSDLETNRYSKFLIKVLEVAKKHKYLDFKLENKKLKIKILELNNCQAIKPRFEVSVSELDKYIKRFLPARNFGIIIISTTSGLLTHEEAFQKNTGGSLIAYFY